MAGDKEQDRSGRGLSRNPWARSARLLRLPIGAAARTTSGLGRRLTGATAAQVSSRSRQLAAQQLFTVLGELKGGAMKFGQLLSVYEAMLPEEIAAPYREHLRRLQDSAPPMPAARVHAVLTRELGPGWRMRFSRFDDRPVAAASIGQVHRAQWAATGAEVAVKVQYPGADEALRSDLKQLRRLGRLVEPFAGAIDMGPLIDELTERISEELDYRIEAVNQQQAAEAFADDPEFCVPGVLDHTVRVMVSDWVEGAPLGTVAAMPPVERNEWGLRYARFLFAGPSRAGLLHADPHPGNFKVLSDGRLGVVDFGLVSRMPEGLPPAIGRLLSLALGDDAGTVAAGLRTEGFVDVSVDAQTLLEFLSPFVEPARRPNFHFSRAWLRSEYERVRASSGRSDIGSQINLPPDYLLVHRVWMGGIAVLAQLDVHADFGAVLTEFLPGYQPDRAI
ncbi:MAG: AarF/ABC1/UbiB kinase family protein [Propionibacteriales bacterium]|nr:AarF/ABC1/UbiB kinase family protein [Propionibacteriales bacterium]